MKIYTYVIAVDGGAAPNTEPPLTTLAICKPRIRRGANPGDMVIAFNGATLGADPNAVRWAGVVQEKLTFADYWFDPRFQAKKPGASPTPDNIYEPRGTRVVQVPNTSHERRGAERDLSGGFVLALQPAWHFGPQAPVLPASFGLRMTGGRRGHRVHHVSEQTWGELREWLDGHRDHRGDSPPRSTPPCSGRRRRTC